MKQITLEMQNVCPHWHRYLSVMVRRKWRLFVRKVCAWLACTNKNPLPSFLLVLFLGGVVWLFVDISSRHWQQDREIHISEAIRNYGFLVGAGLGLGVAVWRSVVAAKTLKHSQETQREDSLYKTRSLNTDRFQRASAMLAEKKRTVRVAGIFVLRDLAAQHPEDYHNTVMSLLCLYLREQQKKDTKASTGAEDSGKQAAAENTSEENQEAKKEAGWRGELPLDALEIIRIISGRENRDKETDGLIDLHGCDFCGYHFPFKTDLSGVNLHASNLSGVHLFRANLSGAHLWDANLSGAELLGANLSGAELLGANLSGADLGNANLSGAELGNANLSGADLFRANLSGAHLFRANLSGAHLQGASFSGAHLLDANFSGAYLENANFHDTQIYKTVFWNEERGGATQLTQQQLDVMWAFAGKEPMGLDNLKPLGLDNLKPPLHFPEDRVVPQEYQNDFMTFIFERKRKGEKAVYAPPPNIREFRYLPEEEQ